MKPDHDPTAPPGVGVRDLLNAQCGRTGWPELQRHFARGSLLVVAADLDLIEAAARVVEDDREQVQSWLATGRLQRAETRHAQAWESTRPTFWAVVAAPWVLVQEISPGSRDPG